MRSPKIALISLGCSKNLVDSEKLLGRLAGGGAVLCQNPQLADILIVNTCGFVKEAKEESIETILQMARLKEGACLKKLIVTGCLAQRYQDELTREIPEIDHVVGLGHFDTVARLSGLKEWPDPPEADGEPRMRLSPRHYAYLKVSEGCDNRCSYCAIPSIRGPFRSRPMEEVLHEARQLVATGAVELNLIAQDSTLYGIDLYGRQCLHELLQTLAEIGPLRWIRLLYTHPAHFYPGLIQEMKRNEKLVKYVDLPIQHINDDILQKMGRGVRRSQIEALIERLKEGVPGLFLRTTVIVGFPGEGEKEFEELLEFLRDAAFERLGAFCYSREEGTPAASLRGHIPEGIKKKRHKEVMSLQQDITFKKNALWIGRTLEVLVEDTSDGLWQARSHGDAPEVDGSVILTGSGLSQGQFRRVLVTDSKGYNLVAHCLD